MFSKSFSTLTLLAFIVVIQSNLVIRSAYSQVSHLGTIDFPNSGSAEIQDDFITAILLLHSFEYDDARELFQQVQKKDPGFALAYWGEAMTYNHPLWGGGEQDLQSARQVLEKLGTDQKMRLAAAKSDREKNYLSALEVLLGKGTKLQRDAKYSEKMAEVSAKYPDDLEAKAFYSLSLLGRTGGDRNIRMYMKAAAVAQEVLAVRPHHPGGLHYFIHSVDDPDHAPLGMPVAKVYGELIQDAEHALHMPSHIYAPLGLWKEVIVANEKSWQANDEHSRIHNKPSGIGKFHALLWLQYGYLQAGRYKDARRVLDEVAQSVKKIPTQKTRAILSQMQARDALESTLPPISYPSLKTDDLEVAGGSSDIFRQSWFAAEKKDFLNALRYQKEIETRLKRARVLPTTKVSCQCGGNSSGIVESKGLIQASEIMIDQLRAKILLEHGKTQEALVVLRACAMKSDGIPYADGPPIPIKPAHELLADVLFKLKKYADAKKEYELSLMVFPNRSESLVGAFNSARKLGDKSAADFLKQIQINWEHADPENQRLFW